VTAEGRTPIRPSVAAELRRDEPACRLDKSTIVDTFRSVDMSVLAAPVVCCAPLGAPALSEDEAAATAELFKALADPARVRIMNTLATNVEPVCACEFEPALDLSQPTVSHHLKKLLDAGLIEREQRGRWAYFSLKRDAVEKLAAVADLKGVCC
jgi:ArsR family transcriptional regulator, arsenate/arsenite/antimonite-responsive transcriptional repressor